MHRTLFVSLAVLCSLLAACEPLAVRSFRRDYHCFAPVKTKHKGQFSTVTGCDSHAEYRCTQGICVEMQPEAYASDGYAPVGPSEPEAPSSATTVKKIRHKDGYDLYTAEVQPAQGGLHVVAGAAPARTQDIVMLQLMLSTQRMSAAGEACDVRLLVDFQRTALPEVPVRQERHELVWELPVPMDTALAIVRARQATWRVCGNAWDMDDGARSRLGALLARAREEAAWDDAPRQAGGPSWPPEGGWPTWSKAADAMPLSQSGKALEGPELYERIHKSVLPVHVKGAGDALGSAVAVSPTHLLTNCHVVQGARSITVGAGEGMAAKLIKAEPKADRCVLEVSGGLVPVSGVRGHGTLRVGERVFTLGTPGGFESTLGEGLVSGLREEANQHYVQTSAPISPGSSGGGLFDRYGNLLGITTLMYVGRDGHAQALNFAIAIDEFYAD